ncbi:MAG: MATE family efflux transporter [Phycisphaerales bacterium]
MSAREDHAAPDAAPPAPDAQEQRELERLAAEGEVDAFGDPAISAASAGAAADDDRIIRSGRLAGKGLWQSIWILSIPVLVQQAMAALVGTTDTLMAGNLPPEVTGAALDGVGFGASFMWVASIVLMGLGIGAQAIIARAMGAGDRAEAERAGGTAVAASFAASVLGAVAVWMLAPYVAAWMGLSDHALGYATDYIRVIALSMPLMGVMTVGGMALHGAGDTRAPSVIAVGVNVLNIFFTWALSGVTIKFGSFTIPHLLPIDAERWGVAGIAAGTAISYIAGGAWTLHVLGRGVKDFTVRIPQMRPQRAMLRRIVVLGVPNMLEGATMWLTTSVGVTKFIGIVAERDGGLAGPVKGLFGAHMVTVRWEAFSFLPGFAMGTAAGALAGQYLGAGSPALARRAIGACLWIAMGMMGLMGVVFMVEGEALARLMSRDPVVLAEVPKTLFICGIVQVFFAMGLVIRGGLKGCGDAKGTFIITLVSTVCVRVPLAYLFGVVLGYGLPGIWIGLCIELGVRGLLFLWRYLRGGWDRVRV